MPSGSEAAVQTLSLSIPDLGGPAEQAHRNSASGSGPSGIGSWVYLHGFSNPGGLGELKVATYSICPQVGTEKLPPHEERSLGR